MSVINIGASAGVSHSMSGVVYKTFTMELNPLHEATLNALSAMDIRVKKSIKKSNRHEIFAVRAGRKIIITLEPVSRVVTQMKIVVRKNFYSMDSATALEIVTQTEKAFSP